VSASTPPDKAPPETATRRLRFLDLAETVVTTWDRAGFAWPELVDGFGGGDGTGLPSLGTFEELAADVVTGQLSGQPEADLRRLMRSRLYHRHCDIDRHCDFINGDDNISRADLIAVAVWNHLYDRMEREYVEPKDGPEAEDCEDEREAATEQLALPL
jgi:hypothetical protein